MATTAHGRNISERGENDCQFLFTVFTPTYNRGHTLKRVYESLKNQTCKNFEWLIIDDGSTDNTRGQVDEWCRQGQVTIRYEFQPNQGKHSAHNYALDLARGKFFLPLDSDDSCVPQALERFKCHWDTIPTEVRSEFSGVCALCVDQHGRLVGDRFPHDVFDSNSLEVTFRFRIKGEKWGFHRTDILKHFRFPAMANASFIPESFVWFAIARHYKERYVNEALRIYWSQPSDATEQLTVLFNASRHAAGRYLYYKTMLNEYTDWLPQTKLQFMRIAANYGRMAFHLGYGLHRQVAEIRPWMSKVLWAMTLPVGMVLYVSDKNAS